MNLFLNMKNHQKFLLQMKKKLEISTENQQKTFSTPEKLFQLLKKLPQQKFNQILKNKNNRYNIYFFTKIFKNPLIHNILYQTIFLAHFFRSINDYGLDFSFWQRIFCNRL